MPLCTLHLLSLTSSSSAPSFLSQLQGNVNGTNKPRRQLILASQPHTPPVIRVSSTAPDADRINGTQWHLLVILQSISGETTSGGGGGDGAAALKQYKELSGSIKEELMLSTGIPSKLIQSYRERRAGLVDDGGPPLAFDVLGGGKKNSSSSSSSSEQQQQQQTIEPSRDSQNLELSDGLVDFARRLTSSSSERGEQGKGPVWMLNLLKFKEGKKEQYIQYGKAFSQVSRRFGGTVVLVGSIPPSPESYWDEFALAHYPSISHFVDMSADGSPGGYQEINRRWRLGSLEDTGILCTTPVRGEGEGVGKGDGRGAKL